MFSITIFFHVLVSFISFWFHFGKKMLLLPNCFIFYFVYVFDICLKWFVYRICTFFFIFTIWYLFCSPQCKNPLYFILVFCHLQISCHLYHLFSVFCNFEDFILCASLVELSAVFMKIVCVFNG